MYSMLVNIKITYNAGIQLASYKIRYIVLLMLGLCSSGSIYGCKNININTKSIVNVCILRNMKYQMLE
jgi:hypothetical protein